MRENPANGEKASRIRGAADLHNKPWKFALKAMALFMKYLKGSGRAASSRGSSEA
jgi:hypothetical protein